MKREIHVAWLVASLSLCASASGQVSGIVTLDGSPPLGPPAFINPAAAGQPQWPPLDPRWTVGPNHELSDVVVYIEGKGPNTLQSHEIPSPCELTINAGAFSKRVAALAVGQELKFINADRIARHHPTALLQNNLDFSFGVDPGKSKSVKLSVAEIFEVHCSFHHNERVWVCCVPNSFFSTTGADGKFTIEPAPPDGDYTLCAWHVGGRTQMRSIAVKGGKENVEFAFESPRPRRGRAEVVPDRVGQPPTTAPSTK